MAWKPKEKKLTHEEALTLAKKELTPYWFGSDPLIGAAQTEQQIQIFPLSHSFNEKPWFILFVDIMHPIGELSAHFTKEWHKRYYQNGLNFLMILKASYTELFTPPLIQHFIKKLQIPFPVVLDHNNLLTAGFGIKDSPSVILYSNEKKIFTHTPQVFFSNTELSIHHFLRATDPGLPLLPIYQSSEKQISHFEKIEFGRGQGVQFPSPGFIINETGYGIGAFKHMATPVQLKKNDLIISGSWAQDHERIITMDSHAAIHFYSEHPQIAVVAQALTKHPADRGEIVIEVNGAPAYDTHIGENVILDESGLSMVKIESGNLFHILKNLPTNRRNISLTFPKSNLVPIAVYGLRLGGPS